MECKVTNFNNSFNSSTNGFCITLIIKTNPFICANIGDCQAVLGKKEKGIYKAIQLNKEHFPDTPDEIKRIIKYGGELKILREKIEFFFKNSEIPGLKVARSICDSIAHNVGIISEPDIKSYDYDGNEKFLLIGNKEFWNYLYNNECVEVIKYFY